MNRALFGTDGVRGLAGQYPLDDAGAEQIGRAVGTHFAEPSQTIVLGHDPRESSEPLTQALTAGLTAVGINVVAVGVLPTPGLAYLTREGDFVAGVMVTASHNPYTYNGVKVFDTNGDKLNDETESELNRLIDSEIPTRGPGKTTTNAELVKNYEDFLVASAGGGLDFSRLRLAVDSANGAASGIAGRVFERLGAQVTTLFDKPDGRNINASCGATAPEALSQAVIDQHLDLGIALDGDADRLIMIDNQGREVNGDYLLYLLAVSQQQRGVVATVMSNLGLETALAQHGISLERVQVGDRYVLEGLEGTGFRLGGEQSGHIIFPQLLATGDGLLAAVQTLQALGNSHKSLAQWRDEVELLPQALVNIALDNKELLNRPSIKSYVQGQIDHMAGKGRILIRPSGTEPLARVMVEAPDAQAGAQRIAKELERLLHEASTESKHD